MPFCFGIVVRILSYVKEWMVVRIGRHVCNRLIKNHFNCNAIVFSVEIPKMFFALMRWLLLHVFISIFNFQVSIPYEKNLVSILLCPLLSFLQSNSKWTNEFLLQDIWWENPGKSFISACEPGGQSKSAFKENWSFVVGISGSITR